LRQACEYTKFTWPALMSLEPRSVYGADATAIDSNSPPAYRELMKLVETQRRIGESQAQAFARIYADEGSRQLAEAERAQSRSLLYEGSSTSYAVPGYVETRGGSSPGRQ
jgi:hypothetical protein